MRRFVFLSVYAKSNTKHFNWRGRVSRICKTVIVIRLTPWAMSNMNDHSSASLHVTSPYFSFLIHFVRVYTYMQNTKRPCACAVLTLWLWMRVCVLNVWLFRERASSYCQCKGSKHRIESEKRNETKLKKKHKPIQLIRTNKQTMRWGFQFCIPARFDNFISSVVLKTSTQYFTEDK